MKRRLCISLSAVTLAMLFGASSAHAAAAVSWSLWSVAEPSQFSSSDAVPCQEELRCDSYSILLSNSGDEMSSSPILLTDQLPPGLEPLGIESGHSGEGIEWTCTNEEASLQNWMVRCEFPEGVPSTSYAPSLSIRVSAPGVGAPGELSNRVEVSGGGASAVESHLETPNGSSGSPAFGINEYSFLPRTSDGQASVEAGGHPWQVTTRFLTPTALNSTFSENRYQTIENIESVGVQLPLGFFGNPSAAAQCSVQKLPHNECPEQSRVGKFAALAGAFAEGQFEFTGASGLAPPAGCCSSIFNLVPEAGYPAEFGFTFANQTVILYAAADHTASGYGLRVFTTGLQSALETSGASITFFGDPAAVNEAPGPRQAFLTNPAECSGDETLSTIELGSWDTPRKSVSASAAAYPEIVGCSALQFHPTLGLLPRADGPGGARTALTAADSPAGLDVDLQVPQTEGFEEVATPPLKTATVQLPEGLVVNPSAADGLQGCDASGPQGINIGSSNIGPKGQDLGDPEATELGEGHKGGNSSPYDDGFWHAASGGCPAASTLGTVEATTPLLPEPVKGQIFLGTPECAPCSSADAEGGKLIKLYLEINDPISGTIIKLPGSVSANPGTGRLTASFKENPQLPFSDLKLHFKTGPRAALTSPPTCGTYSSASSLEPWSAPETPTAVSNSSFNITSGPGGKACGPPPNAPKFEAGTTSTQAGAYSPFVLKLSREDGTQRLKALNVTLPKGLTGKLAGVQECSNAAIMAAEGTGGRAQQAAPSCPLASELGAVNVGAGSGPTPIYVQGHAYLAGPYKGAPLSMAIITPAVAGPFDLGTVVVRAALFVDLFTAQITVKSDPIPQIRSGIPLDVRSIAVNISRNQFTLNPTSCDPKTLAASIVADASTAAVSNPFQVGGCSALKFKPKLALSLKGGTKRTKHPALTATVTMKPGEANIARAQVTLPHSAFLDQAHIRTVCTRVQFAAHACPAASVYGKAIAYTPLLDQPLSGPVYLRSSSNKLPDLVADLGGQIEVALDGKVDTGKGAGIRNTFEVVPDAPVSKFVLSMQGGSKGLLVNSENICKKPQKALAHFVAQNGKILNLHPLIANSCKGAKKHHKRRSAHR